MLDTETGEEADRLNNLSEWVRIQLRAKANGVEKVFLEDISTRRLAAIILNRVDSMNREAGNYEQMIDINDDLLSIAEAIREWFTNGS